MNTHSVPKPRPLRVQIPHNALGEEERHKQLLHLLNLESQSQTPPLKRKRKGSETEADPIILQVTTRPPPPTDNFSHLKCQSSVRKITPLFYVYLHFVVRYLAM